MTLYLSQTGLLTLLVVFFLSGFVLAALYDLLRLAREALDGRGRLMRVLRAVFVNIFDLLFFVFVSAVFAIAFYACNSGKVRPAAFIAAAAGLALYRKTLSAPFMRLVKLAVRLIMRLLRLLLRPAYILLRAVLRRIFSFARKRMRIGRSRRAVKRLLKEASLGFPHASDW